MSPLRTLFQIEAREPAPLAAPKQSEGGSDASSPSGPCLDFIASDDSLDRYDEVISASGWRLDAYRRNPVFQNAHQYGDIMFTLGKALITEVRCASTRTPNPEPGPHLFQRIEFATDVNPIARIAYGLYRGKFLNAVSVGFVPLRWIDASGAEHTSVPSSARSSRREAPCANPSSFRTPHSSLRTGALRTYLEQELLEVSAVGIPANPNALALGLKAGSITKSDLEDTLDLLRSLTIDCDPCRPDATPRSAPSTPTLHHSICLRAPTHSNLALLLARELHRILRRA